MNMHEWFQLLAAALGGGVTVTLLNIAYQEWRRRDEQSESSRYIVDLHLDPLLKVADELVGKLRSLADEDFKSLYGSSEENDLTKNSDFTSLAFLIARFWATIEIRRHEGVAISLAKDVRGERLQRFLDCIESRGIRIVNRIEQRAIGELLLSRHRGGAWETIPFIGFVELIENAPQAERWFASLKQAISRAQHTRERQSLLRYGAVVHAMIDTLDPEHEVTRDRPSYPNKLSRKSWKDLKYRVFRVYLEFVPNPEKYIGPPKKGGASQKKAARET